MSETPSTSSTVTIDRGALEALLDATRQQARHEAWTRLEADDDRVDCFICYRRPKLVRGHIGPHVDKAGHICPGSGEVAS